MGEHLKKLKELRLAKGISHKEIAEYLGITVAAYSLYERGNREPNISILRKIAEYYNISMDELLEVDTEPMAINVHFTNDEFTENELKEIRNFADYVKSKRGPNINLFTGVGRIDFEQKTDVNGAIDDAKKSMSNKNNN